MLPDRTVRAFDGAPGAVDEAVLDPGKARAGVFDLP